MKKFCTALTSHVVNVINFKKKKMLPITEKKNKITTKCNRMVPLQKSSTQKLAKDKNHQKVRDYCHIAHNICNLKFNIPNKIPAVFTMDQATITILS